MAKKEVSPKTEEPKLNPNPNPKSNPNPKHHNDLDLEYDIDNNLKYGLDEIYLQQQKPKWPHIDFDFEVNTFMRKG